MALADTARLIASLELQDKFSRPAVGITRSLGSMERGFSQISRGTGQVAGGLATLGTRAALLATGGLAAVVTKAASFEQAFVGIQKTVDETANTSFADLNAALREMARTIPVSFEELAQIGEAGGALGIGADSLEEFIDVVARLSVSTNLSSEEAATALGQLGNILHLSGEDFRDFSDSLVGLGNAGASTEAQIVELAARFAAAGNSAGLSKEDILALSSAVASMGIEVEAGGSALSRIFNNITTGIGTSSDKAAAFADTLGLSAKEFRTAWDRDALGTLQDFLGELNKLDQFAQADVLKQVGITNVRDIAAVRLLSQNIGLVDEQLRISRESQGALNTESQKFFDTTVGQWKILKQNIFDVGATIGTELLPTVNALSKEFVAFLSLDTTQSGIKQFAGDLANGIKSLVNELRGTDFSGIIDGMKLAATVAKGAFDAFRSLPQPIQQLAIAALVANKVSGGAIGQIAGGLGNILAGTIKLAFPKLDIFSRGSPVNPMFVSVIGGIPGVTGGAPATGAGGGALATAAKFVLGPAAAVIIGSEIAAAINSPTIKPAADFEERQFKAVVDSKDLSQIVHGLQAIEDQQNSDDILEQTALIASNIPFIQDALGNVGPKLEEQKGVLLAQLEEIGLTRDQAEALVTKMEAQTAKTELVRAQAARLAQIEEQAASAARADASSARQIASASSDRLRTTAANTSSFLGKAERAIGIASTSAGYQRSLLGKDFSPKVNVAVNSRTSISVNDVVRAVNDYDYAVNTYGGKIGNIPL